MTDLVSVWRDDLFVPGEYSHNPDAYSAALTRWNKAFREPERKALQDLDDLLRKYDDAGAFNIDLSDAKRRSWYANLSSSAQSAFSIINNVNSTEQD